MENQFTKKYFKEIKKLDNKLSTLLKDRTPKSLYEPCSYILKSGGKRLRSYLVFLSTKAVGGKFSDSYNAAIAVEILHSFTLVHDDIMDNADKRRGKPTLHIKYDTNTAILAGDSLLTIAYENLLKDCKHNPVDIVNTFNNSVIEVCEGQSMDKDFEIKKSVTIDEYKAMVYKKTASLIKMCCSIGAKIGGGSRKEVNALENYGKYLGMAFQLQDDLLDIMGTEKKFGKIVGGDLIEGKKTYLFLKALERGKGEDKKVLLKFIKNNGIKRSQVKRYKLLYEKLDIFNITKSEIEGYTKRSISSLRNISNLEAKENLIWLANSLINRSQ